MAVTSAAFAQQQQRQDQRSRVSEDQVRSFFDQMQQTIRQASRNQNFAKAAQQLRRNLAEDAANLSTNTLTIDGRQVASSVVMLDEDTASAILGFAASAMHNGGRRNIQGYRFEVNVRDVQPMRGNDNAVRVSTTMRETGTLNAGSSQQVGRSQQQSQPDQGDQPSGQHLRQASDQSDMDRGSVSPGIGGQQAEFPSMAQCQLVLRRGDGGQIKIGSTVCRNNTQIRS